MDLSTRFTLRSRGALRPGRWLVVAIGLAGTAAAVVVQAQGAMPLPQIWTGRMVVPEGVSPGVTGDRFELRVFQTSTDEEVAGLVLALKGGGQPGLRNAMFQQKSKGWIRIGNLAATEVAVLRVADLPDGTRRVRLFSERPLRLYDKTDPPGSMDHPFGYLELVADSTGKGKGTLVAAASMAIDTDGSLRMESAGTPVVRIYDVTTDKPPAAPPGMAAPAPKP